MGSNLSCIAANHSNVSENGRHYAASKGNVSVNASHVPQHLRILTSLQIGRLLINHGADVSVSCSATYRANVYLYLIT